VIFKEKGINLCKKRGESPKKKWWKRRVCEKKEKKREGEYTKIRYFILNSLYFQHIFTKKIF
jgi:hypothetical protein